MQNFCVEFWRCIAQSVSRTKTAQKLLYKVLGCPSKKEPKS
ncbi:hypothetical protein PTQ35_04915 [Campylobacter sp. 46490-21]|nr:hypothetical protein [Campylobacter magnus]MDD0848158.1 hypothetical protein [Campylobacter magnus]